MVPPRLAEHAAEAHLPPQFVELIGRRKPTESELVKVQPDAVIVELRYEGQDVLLAMRFDAYTGLSSWLEAGPVIGVGTWR